VLAADYIADELRRRGVSHVFEVAGGMIAHLIDAIHRSGDIRLVTVHHEQAAGLAAEGWARVSGIPGVAMATSGPGATNLLTAIGSCYFDSTPAVFITGQVNRAERKRGRGVRQLGFQETDIVSVASPLTKACHEIERSEDLVPMVQEAFRVAAAGRPGPVLLDIPMDVQRAELGQPAPAPGLDARERHGELDVDRILDDLLRARRPRRAICGRSGRAADAPRRAWRAGRELVDGRRRAAVRPSAPGRDDRHVRQPMGQPSLGPRRLPARAGKPARHPSDRSGRRGVQGRPCHPPRRL
jgi:acetolactate synthase-1/2/3 large subunit